MLIPNYVRSKVLKDVIKQVPSIVKNNPDTIRNMVVNQDKSVFGMEDAAELIADVENVKIDEKNTNFDIFSDVKLNAELQLAANVELNRVHDISEKWNDLKISLKELDDKYGPELDIIFDSIRTQPNVDSNVIKNIMESKPKTLDVIEGLSEN